ncbi:hypothetical protein O0L34_g8839 [Tuta absoluta]|nr:hypothetical protein O0L34_g8839 [Tuta absoluta]
MIVPQDPEELMRRKFRAKCLFRRIGRLCMENVFWLQEDIDEYIGVEDVKRRVEQAVRGTPKLKKQLLSIRDKALLNKSATERTEHEKKYLNRKIGGLKCFKRYPNHVKRKLAAVTYFKYVPPNRVVVREHHEAHALYFIVSGTVMVSHLVYDELLEQDVSVEIGEMVAGEMFGEISLLHNIPRTATVMTIDHCEFLMLLKEDFNNVLLTSIQKQWDEVRLAMSSFTYFDALDEVSFRECCIVAKMKKYGEFETVLGDGVGVRNYVYFILTGRVQMIESLKVFVSKRVGKNYYTLFDPWVPPEPSETDFEKKYFANYRTHDSDDENFNRRSSINIRAASKRSIGTQMRTDSMGTSILKVKSKRFSIDKTSKIRGVGEKSSEKMNSKMGIFDKAASDKAGGDGKRASFFGDGDDLLYRESNSFAKMVSMGIQAGDCPRTVEIRKKSISQSSKLMLPPNESEHVTRTQSVRYSESADGIVGGVRGKRNLKTFFMQVCIMNPGSTFGFGENMRDRRIVALTPVSCMLIPKMWLLQHNHANIWTRIQYYLQKKIPNKHQLFDEFCKQRVWEDFREQCVSDVVARSKTVNYTTLHDVPYSIRLEELFDI